MNRVHRVSMSYFSYKKVLKLQYWISNQSNSFIVEFANVYVVFDKLKIQRLYLYLLVDLSNLALETDVSPNRNSDHQRHKSPATSDRERRSVGPEQLKPLPDSLLFDIRNVQAMTDIKTHIGYARAWVRLALEKKLLSRHLKSLLSHSALLKYA